LKHYLSPFDWRIKREYDEKREVLYKLYNRKIISTGR